MEPRWDPVTASGDPGGCLPGLEFLRDSLFFGFPYYRGNAGCYLRGGTTDSGNPSFHSRGRAIDIWIATGHSEVGSAMFYWCYDHRNEIGLNEVIFNSRIWRADNPSGGIRSYTANRHTDHIHIALNLDGARMVLPFFRSTIQPGDDDPMFDGTDKLLLKDLHAFMSQMDKVTHAKVLAVEVQQRLILEQNKKIMDKLGIAP